MSQMVEMKTGELVGLALDWAVFCSVYPGMRPTINVIPATSVDRKPFSKPISFPQAIYLSYSGAYDTEIDWSPSTDWNQGGPLRDQYRIDVQFDPNGKPVVMAHLSLDKLTYRAYGPTSLVAAMRCIVTSQYGDTVQVPAELL